MIDYIKGGRGKRAPYQTVVIRVPEPLADSVNGLIETYRTTGEIKPVTALETETCNKLKAEILRILEGVLPIKANNATSARKAIQQVIELLKE